MERCRARALSLSRRCALPFAARSDRKIAAEIEKGDLAHLAADALTAHQAIGEVAFAGDFVVGSGLTDIHIPNSNEKARGKTGSMEILWHNKTTFKTRT